ncbi:hypothetical protein [Kribbella sp. ALI-6-A]|nr:hypothetical protein [Kribbella sp. ALI-6-A]
MAMPRTNGWLAAGQRDGVFCYATAHAVRTRLVPSATNRATAAKAWNGPR